MGLTNYNNRDVSYDRETGSKTITHTKKVTDMKTTITQNAFTTVMESCERFCF